MTRVELTTGFIARTMRDLGYRVIEGADRPISGGAADSRNVSPGQLFTAFLGENVDGNLFIDDALANGAQAVICEREPTGEWPGRTIVVVADAVRAVGELAHEWRNECNPRVLGITGTVGKTTAKEIAAGVLSARFRAHRSEGNLNSREGLPLALLSLRRDHEVSVLEIAMDSKGEIAYLCGIAEPDAGVVLNIGLTHVSKLGSIEAIANEKLSLARYASDHGTAIVNIDDPRIASGLPSKNVLTFGQSADARLRWANAESLGLQGSIFELSYGSASVRAACPVPGLHVIPGAVAAIASALVFGMTLKEATQALSSIETRGRSRVVTSRTGATIIDDRYNSSPASLAGALQLLGSLPARRIALLGRMAELGDYEEEEHRKAGIVAAASCDVLYASGPVCRALVDSAREAGLDGARWFETKEEAAHALAPLIHEGDTVLVKASRGEAFETILPALGVLE